MYFCWYKPVLLLILSVFFVVYADGGPTHVEQPGVGMYHTTTALNYTGFSNEGLVLTTADSDSLTFAISYSGNDVFSVPESVRILEGTSDYIYIPVSLLFEPDSDVTVRLASSPGTSLKINPPELEFTPQDWYKVKEVELRVDEDNDIEHNKITLRLTALVSGDNVIKEVDVVIEDKDRPPLIEGIEVPSWVLVPEGDFRNLPVKLSAPPSAKVVVNLEVRPGTSIETDPSMLTFTTENWSRVQQVKLIAKEDDNFKNNEAKLTLKGSGGDYEGIQAGVLLTVIDNDEPSLVVPAAVVVLEGSTGTLPVKLSTQPDGNVTVTLSGITNSNIELSSEKLTFTWSDWNEEKYVRLTSSEDDNLDDETLYLEMVADGGGYVKTNKTVRIDVLDNDNNVNSLVVPGLVSVPEGGSSELLIALSTQPAGDVDVTVTFPAENNLIVEPTEFMFNAENWQVPQTLLLTAAKDDDRMDDMLSMTFSADGVGYVEITKQVMVKIEDNTRLGTVITNPRRDMDILVGSSKDIIVALSERPTNQVRVSVTPETQSGLRVVPGTLTFSTLNYNVGQTVTVTAEISDYPAGWYQLHLNANGGGYDSNRKEIFDVEVLSVIGGELVIEPVQIWNVFEGETVEFTAKLSKAPLAPVQVTLKEAEAGMLRLSPETLTFTTMNYSLAQEITVTPAVVERDGSRFIDLHARGGGYNVKEEVQIFVLDAVNSTLVLEPARGIVPLTEEESGEFTVKLSKKPEGTVKVNMKSVKPPGGLRIDPGELTFNSGNRWDNEQTVVVKPVVLADYTKGWRHIELTAHGEGFDKVRRYWIWVEKSIQPMVVVNSKRITVSEGGSARFSVHLSKVPQEAVTVTIRGPDEPTDHLEFDPNQLRFSISDYNKAKQVVLNASEDDDFLDDTINLTLSALGGGYDGLGEEITVTIVDDDEASLIVVPSRLTIHEGSSEGFTVRLSAEPTGEVMVDFTENVNHTIALDVTPHLLIFSQSDWHTGQGVTVTAEDNDYVDGSDSGYITLSAQGGGYDQQVETIEVRVEDDEKPGLIVSPSRLPIDEGASGTFTVHLSAQPREGVTVTLTGYEKTEPVPTELRFTGGDWSVPQSVTVYAEEDADYIEDKETLLLTASGGGYDGVREQVEVVVLDDPISVSIHDAAVREGESTILQMRVELNRPHREKLVTVQYHTVDETAEDEADYTASRGVVVFERNSTRGFIQIAILDDDIAEEEETFTVRLSHARHAEIRRGVGTVTIVDDERTPSLRIHDPYVGFGDRVIEFVVSLSHASPERVTVRYRTEDGSMESGEDYVPSVGVLAFPPGTVEAWIAVPLLGETVDRAGETFSVHLRESEHARIERAVAVVRTQEAAQRLSSYTARFVRTASVSIVEALAGRLRTDVDGGSCGAGVRADLVRLWQTSAPSLGELLSGCQVSRREGAWGMWGRGSFHRFHGEVDGEVSTGLAGLDYRWQDRWITGVLFSHSQGTGPEEMQAGLTGLYPYVVYRDRGTGIWMTGGYGWGTAAFADLRTDLSVGFGALGVRGHVYSGVSYHGDVLYAGESVQAVQVYRIRAGLEGRVHVYDWLHPYVEASVRQDGGSAETGIGLEIGGGLRVGVGKLNGEVRSQGILVHSAEGFREWGISGSLQYGGGAQGLTVWLRPSWGPSQGMLPDHSSTLLDAAPVGSGRTEMEIGYGWKRVRSVLGMTKLPGGTLLRLGGELRPVDQFSLSVFGLSQAAEFGQIGVNLQGALRY